MSSPASAETSAAVPVALITGGAKRVGRHVALYLAQRGWDIAITYHRSGEEASTLAERVEGLGHQCAIIQADFSDPEPAAGRVAQVVGRRFSRLDLLLHNASLYEPGGLFDTNLQQMRRYFAVHAETPFLLTRALADQLRNARGTVIAMSDLNVERPRPAYAAYTMSKAALANLVPVFARELAPEVTANAIAPGVVEWPPDMSQDQKDAYLKRVPLARAGTPDDVARLVHFLCTDGKYITGETIRLDGGRGTR